MDSKVQDFLSQRKIASLFHFTHIENLRSISENGLLTKKSLLESQIIFKETDSDRLDGILDSISLSLSKPNHWMFAQKQRVLNNELIVLELPATLLTDYPFIAFPSNAARSVLKNLREKNPDHFISEAGLKNLFGFEKLRQDQNIPLNEPTDIQSEIMVTSNLPFSLISRIHIANMRIDTLKQNDEIGALMDDVDYLIHQGCDCSFFSESTSNSFDGRRFEVWWKEVDGK